MKENVEELNSENVIKKKLGHIYALVKEEWKIKTNGKKKKDEYRK